MKYTHYSFRHWLVLYLGVFGTAFVRTLGLVNQPDQSDLPEHVCKSVSYIHPDLAQSNKDSTQIAVDVNQDGLVYEPSENTLGFFQKIYNGYQMGSRRNELSFKAMKQKSNTERLLNNAYQLDKKHRQFTLTSEMHKHSQKLHFNLISKFAVYRSALQTQQGANVGNCGEHADLYLAHYLLEKMHTKEPIQIQRVTLYLSKNGLIDVHTFALINSGVTDRQIKNNPEAVSTILSHIDKNPHAYLCDKGFNQEAGTFGAVRQKNPAYGLGSSVQWTGLDIETFDTEIDLDFLPAEAVELRKAFHDINERFNHMIKSNITRTVDDRANAPEYRR